LAAATGRESAGARTCQQRHLADAALQRAAQHVAADLDAHRIARDQHQHAGGQHLRRAKVAVAQVQRRRDRHRHGAQLLRDGGGAEDHAAQVALGHVRVHDLSCGGRGGGSVGR
jgi:hypothetical protein